MVYAPSNGRAGSLDEKHAQQSIERREDDALDISGLVRRPRPLLASRARERLAAALNVRLRSRRIRAPRGSRTTSRKTRRALARWAASYSPRWQKTLTILQRRQCLRPPAGLRSLPGAAAPPACTASRRSGCAPMKLLEIILVQHQQLAGRQCAVMVAVRVALGDQRDLAEEIARLRAPFGRAVFPDPPRPRPRR